jgi:D-glycero-alpha-D-manno-heptose-7-phosphate kinase
MRIGLVGGGTDIEAFSSRYGGAVLNTTIDKYAFVRLARESSGKILFESTDLGIREELSIPANPLDWKLPLHQATYFRMMQDFNDSVREPISLSTYVDAPIGSGLGSSSTLVVAMIKAYSQFMSLDLEIARIAELAHQIERVDCGFAGGRQDQYSAAFGGLNYIEFHKEGGVDVERIHLEKDVELRFTSSLLLYFTGVSRQSSGIISDQIGAINRSEPIALKALMDLKGGALEARNSLVRGDFDFFCEVVRENWERKKATSKLVSNEGIDQMYSQLRHLGIKGAKISGAGGGGFMLLFLDPDRKAQVLDYLSKQPGQAQHCSLSSDGVSSWRVA